MDASVHDLAYDGKRDLVYVATADLPSVDVYALPGLVAQSAIPLPGHPCADESPNYYLHVAVPGPSDPIPGALAGQLLEVVNTPVFLHKLLVSPDDRTLIALGTRTILAFDLTQSTSASFARAKRRPARARTAIAARVRSAPASVAMPRVLWR